MQLSRHCERFVSAHSHSFRAISLLTILVSLLAILLCLVVRQSLGEVGRCRHRLRTSGHRGARLLRSEGHVVLAVTRSLHTPLTAVGKYTRLLPKRRGGDHGSRCTRGVLRSSSCVVKLIGALVKFCLLSANEGGPVLSVFQLRALFDRATQGCNSLTGGGGLQLAATFSNLSIMMDNSHSRLRRVLGGLLSGTVGFAQRNRVHLRTRCQGGRLRFSMRSANAKVARRRAAQVFATFRQLSGTHGIPNFKLKLTVTDELISKVRKDLAMGDGPNRNDAFATFLPLLRTSRSARVSRAHVTASCRLSKVGMLIVSSSQVRLGVAGRVFGHGKIQYSYYRADHRLIAQLQSRECSLLLASVRVPRASNCKVLRLLQTSGVRGTGAVPIVTMATQISSSGRCLSNNFSNYVRGPFSVRRLVGAITRIVKRGSEGRCTPSFSLVLSKRSGERRVLTLFVRRDQGSLTTLATTLSQRSGRTTTSVLRGGLPL